MTLRVGLLLVVGLVGLGACTCDSFRFYEVTRTTIEECDIRPNGEFCNEPESFSPPVVETWAVERVGGKRRVYADEEVWVVNPSDENDDPNLMIADKLEIAAREPGPCVTTITRSFQIIVDDFRLDGSLAESLRVEGPEECGETPSGLRRLSEVVGQAVGAP